MSTLAPLIVAVLGILVVLKFERDKTLARSKFHLAYEEGLKDGFRDAKECWRQELEAAAKGGLKELLEHYPALVKVVENRPAAAVKPEPPATIENNSVFELPRLAYTIIVDAKSRPYTRYGELKATWEKLV